MDNWTASMDNWTATTEHALTKKWKVVDSGHMMHGFRAEDMSIITDDNKEVIGCSEWMRAERAIFDHIVRLHNDNLVNKQAELRKQGSASNDRKAKRPTREKRKP